MADAKTTAVPAFDLDLENVDELNKPAFTPFPQGNYTLKIAEKPKAQLSKPTEKNPEGCWMLNLVLVGDDPETGSSKRVWDNLVFTQKSLFKVRQFLLSAGFEGNMNASALFEDEFLEGLVDREVQADLKIKANEWPVGNVPKTYTMKNVVDTYTSTEVPSKLTASTEAAASGGGLDDIPF